MHYCHVRITLPGSGRVDHMPVPKVVKFTASLVSRSHPLHISSLRLESKKLTLYYLSCSQVLQSVIGGCSYWLCGVQIM